MIEGVRVDFNSYTRYKEMEGGIIDKNLTQVEDLINAYDYARKHTLSKTKILKAHALLSKNILTPKSRGKLRDKNVTVSNIKTGKVICYTAPVEMLEKEITTFFNDIKELRKKKLNYNEIFYYASYIHLVLSQIHPFADGNGRIARLVEKWFLADKLGPDAWFIQSEKNYYRKRKSYYKNIHLGKHYNNLDYDLALDFLLMLPWALKIKV
ncbi:MAG: Fic family protein [Candidatus Cyclobacteriaceae bacterium M3_2C_046]